MSKSTQKSRVLDMTDGNIARLLLSFAFPIFVGCVLQQVYNLSDTTAIDYDVIPFITPDEV